MVIIREEQMKAFESTMLRAYENRVLRTIAKAYPERYKLEGEDQMRVLVQKGIQKGEKYGINDDDDLESYIIILVEHGLDFETAPGMEECLEILKDESLPGDAKVSLIRHGLNSGEV